MKKRNYTATFLSCYVGYFVQALVCGFISLLFVIFNREYGISLPQITLLITVNYIVQLATDALAIFFLPKLGFRRAGIIGHFVAFLGFFLLGVIAPKSSNMYLWMMISVVLYSMGGGLMEVVISPVVENIPTKNKSAAMSLLHSMFAVGSALCIIGTTLGLSLWGWQGWSKIAALWSLVPLINMFAFMFVPIIETKEKVKAASFFSMFKEKTFWGLIIIMMCGGAAEIGISQWASAFAETSLGVSKAMGDILGPCAFAIMMATSRILYSKIADRVKLTNWMMYCGVMAVVCYLCASLSPIPILALVACGLCGFAVGIMWPGTLSLAAKNYPMAGGPLFAIMALSGDLGCTLGPTMVGFVSSAFGGQLKTGILISAIFPLILVVGVWLIKRKKMTI